MPHLDRFLSALVANRASALNLMADDVARLAVGDSVRAVTKQPLSAAQVLQLVREIAPAEAAGRLDAGQDAEFAYASGDGSFSLHVEQQGGRVRARVAPAAAPVAAPAAVHAPPSAAVHAPPSAEVAVSPRADDSAARSELETLLRRQVEQHASDLHLRAGEPPVLRTHGEMQRIPELPPLTSDEIEAMLRSVMPQRNRDEFAASNDTDFAYEIPDCARFRCNALRERRGAAAVFRVIPAYIVTAEELGLSEEVQRLCYLTKGLVLVTGPTGSGKSTTLCGMIDLINRTRTEHVITIEDPIEFVHPNKQCIVTQRQVGLHTGTFKHALRAALREDPDIILVGELRDLETAAIAIETAETGHLVFGTLHTTSAASTIDRLIDQFPADRQAQVRVMLSESLKGVISQTLCKQMGGGRVAAREILLATPAISNLIRESKTFQIPSSIQTSKRLGMVLLNEALMDLVDAERVEPREAYTKANDKVAFANALKQRGHDTSFLEGDLGNTVARPEPPVASAQRSAPQRPPASRA